MAYYFFWKFFNRFINLLLIHLIMNLYTFIHLYKNLELSFWKFIQNLLANLFAICNSIILLATEF